MTTEPADANKATVDAAHREAVQSWGYLIKEDKCGTETFDRLLKGIAEVISRKFEPHDSPDLTPSQLAAFYRAVGGNYDVLFIETPPSSVSFIYRSLGAYHSLQPAPDDDGYSAPTVPALKQKGFVTWQTIQLLLGPEEHVPFLQKAVEMFEVRDPETGNVFPKLLPKQCFPDRPDDAMEAWYENVADRLKREAENDAAEKQGTTRVRVDVDDDPRPTSGEISDNDERHAAASYFSDPLYRKARMRPPFMRHFSKQPGYVDDRGGVVGRVRHMLNPFSKDKRRSPSRRYEDDSFSEGEATPVATTAPAHVSSHSHRYPPANHKRPHPPRRDDPLSTTDSEGDSDGPPSRHRTPVLRHRRSHDPTPTSPREYFPHVYDERRYSHDTTPERRKEDGPPPLYGPTKSPLFATHVAQLQSQNYYDRRPTVETRTSYRPSSNVRYTVKPADADAPYSRERERDRDGYDSKLSRPRERQRRKSDDHVRERDSRDRGDSGRTRSHDRVKEEWDAKDRPRDRDRDRDRDMDRDRDRERDRDRDRDSRVRGARYVQGVQAGVDGRRYPMGY